MSMPAEFIQSGITLQTLMAGIVDAPPVQIHGIGADSRRLDSGDVFLACAGGRTHGIDFAPQAIDAQVAAILYDSDTAAHPDVESELPIIAVPALQSHIGTIADRWYGAPSSSLAVTGVTGTNGKTTVALLLEQCLQLLGERCGYVGTLGKGVGDELSDTGLTTPPCIELHRYLAEFRDSGARYAAVEVSSHALAQGRVDGVRFDSALFTNLSRDHIDYHGDMQSYFEVKSKLFTDCRPLHRVINIDSEFGQRLAERCDNKAVVVSTNFDRVANGRRFVFVRSVVADENGSRIRFDSSWGSAEFRLGLPGDFNVQNAALVLAQLLRQGIGIGEACDALAAARAAKGRMQRVERSTDNVLPAVYVDYAHTPAGLEVALRALRSHCRGALWCVFGCGGDRDRGKRAQMGKVAARLSNRCIVTSDNPRSENPASIIEEVLAGMPADTIAVEDRAAAIAYAIREAHDTDTILLAGKGHEEIQLIGERCIPFSDYAVATARLDLRATQGGGSI